MSDEQPVAWAVASRRGDYEVKVVFARETASEIARSGNMIIVPLYAQRPQDRVVRLPTFPRSEDSRHEGGWNLAMSAVYAELNRAGVKWEVADE